MAPLSRLWIWVTVNTLEGRAAIQSGLTEISRNSTWTNTKSCSWEGVSPRTNTGWGLTGWVTLLCRKGLGSSGATSTPPVVQPSSEWVQRRATKCSGLWALTLQKQAKRAGKFSLEKKRQSYTATWWWLWGGYQKHGAQFFAVVCSTMGQQAKKKKIWKGLY